MEIHARAISGDLEGVKQCVLNRADVNSKDGILGRTPLHVAAGNGHLQIVEYLLSQMKAIDIRDYNGDTALHTAAWRGKLDVVECLLDHNANIDSKNKEGETALHTAAWSDDENVFKCLMDHNADFEARTKQGNTPLHTCVLCYRPNLEVATTLVVNGADFLAKNVEGESPFDIAKRKNRRHILRMFKKELETGLPREMRFLRVDDVDSFKTVLRSGFYYSYLGKIMIVGNEGVGKTAITAILIGKKPSKTRKSTEGIDVHISRTAVDLNSRKLIPKDLSVEEVAYRNLAMHKRYGDSFADDVDVDYEGDDVSDKIHHDAKSDSDSLKTDPDQVTSDDSSDYIATKPSATKSESSLVRKVLQKLGIGKKGDKITADMLKAGTMKAGKKGTLTMNLAPVIILDFAGQRVFYSTHQSFLTYRGIYVLTVDGSLQLDDEMKTESPIPGKYGKPTTRGKS